MSTVTRLAGFAAVLLAAFALAWALGGLVGPVGPAAQSHSRQDDVGAAARITAAPTAVHDPERTAEVSP